MPHSSKFRVGDVVKREGVITKIEHSTLHVQVAGGGREPVLWYDGDGIQLVHRPLSPEPPANALIMLTGTESIYRRDLDALSLCGEGYLYRNIWDGADVVRWSVLGARSDVKVYLQEEK